MAYEPGELKVFNPNKEISKEITLEILIRHRDALKQARTGEIVTLEPKKISDNDRKMNQVRGLNLIISAQREMITVSRPIIYFRSMQKWKKKVRADDKKSNEEKMAETPFNEDANDYNKLLNWLKFLTECLENILTAERTQKLSDDFILKKQGDNGFYFELTENFYAMVEDLESSYEQIYLLMLINKIVSAGIEEDEEMTYKEKEEAAVARVVNA